MPPARGRQHEERNDAELTGDRRHVPPVVTHWPSSRSMSFETGCRHVARGPVRVASIVAVRGHRNGTAPGHRNVCSRYPYSEAPPAIRHGCVTRDTRAPLCRDRCLGDRPPGPSFSCRSQPAHTRAKGGQDTRQRLQEHCKAATRAFPCNPPAMLRAYRLVLAVAQGGSGWTWRYRKSLVNIRVTEQRRLEWAMFHVSAIAVRFEPR